MEKIITNSKESAIMNSIKFIEKNQYNSDNEDIQRAVYKNIKHIQYISKKNPQIKDSIEDSKNFENILNMQPEKPKPGKKEKNRK
jgi:hypothetical protein